MRSPCASLTVSSTSRVTSGVASRVRGLSAGEAPF